MDIARLLHHDDDSDPHPPARSLHRDDPDPHPPMDIRRLIHHDDADTPFVASVYSPVPPPLRCAAPAPPPPSPAIPAPGPERAVPAPETAATPPPAPERAMVPAAAPERVVTTAPPPQRAVARARPPRPRKPTIADLRRQLEACEVVVKHLPYALRDLNDASSPTSMDNSTDGDEDDSDPATAQRIRSFLKHMAVLSEQLRVERAINAEYLLLLKRHHQGRADLRKLMGGVRLDSWYWMCERWRSLARDHFEPLSESHCYAIVKETLQAIEAYKLPEDTKETGAFGWRDSVQLDDQLYVRFMTRKTLQADMKQLVDHAWYLYSDGDAFKKGHLGDNCDFFHQVVQEISPDTYIIQRVERYPSLAQMTHTLAIAFRVQTDTGYMIVYRCIESPRLQGLLKADGLSICGTFLWDSFDVAHTNEQGECDEVRFTAAGSIGSDNPTYAKRWRDELLIALVRYEIECMDQPILSIETIAEGDTTQSNAAP